MKSCSKCKTSKDLVEFSLRNDTNPPRPRSQCKSCSASYTDAYRAANPEVSKNSRYKYEKNRLKTDIEFVLIRRLRVRFLKALKGEYKAGSAINNLGCSIADLKIYLESQFKDGMNWNNRNQWHIDHIKPLSGFDLTNLDHVKEACHYSNLQPLWSAENIRKGNK